MRLVDDRIDVIKSMCRVELIDMIVLFALLVAKTYIIIVYDLPSPQM